MSDRRPSTRGLNRVVSRAGRSRRYPTYPHGISTGSRISVRTRLKRQLPKNLQLELDLIEERIVTDPTRTYQRRYLEDRVVADASGFDEYGFEVTYLDLGDTFRFLGFTVDTER